MEMSGERLIAASREQVWHALNDPEALKAAIPGCEALDKVSDTDLTARVAIKIGPMAAKFSAKVKLENLNPPESYTITGEGNGGAMGFAKGGADVVLTATGPNETLLKYQVKAQVGGKMAQLGARLVDSTAKQMADQFFDRFAANIGVPEPEEVAASAAATPVESPVPKAADSAVSGLALVRAMMPREFLGQSMIFWGGLVVWLLMMALIFLG